MESVAAFRSFYYNVGAVTNSKSFVRKPCQFVGNASMLIGKLESVCAPTNRIATQVSCVKTSVTTETEKARDSVADGKVLKNPTFPKGFEDLILEICDETEIAELKLKIGDFQMQVKRKLAPDNAPAPAFAPALTAPALTAPVAAEPKTASTSSPPKTSSAKSSSFVNIPKEKSAKLVALESSGASGFVLVSSPTVGSFHKGRTLKGKKQPPVCKEGSVIKEGQIIGYVDQFGTELPIKSDIAGEVLKVLLDEGDGVGYGDPLIAVLPSFHGNQ